MTENTLTQVRFALKKFQDGYKQRDVARLDEFMQLFVQNADIELIGIGASMRSAHEWFEGVQAVREIIEGDWKYWGDVTLDVEGAKIHVIGEVAWLSTTGSVTQTQAFDTAIQFHLDDMKAILIKDELSSDEKLIEATHYGMRRLRERSKGLGYSWPFTFTAVLIKIGSDWLFHTIHWAMPVD